MKKLILGLILLTGLLSCNKSVNSDWIEYPYIDTGYISNVEYKLIQNGNYASGNPKYGGVYYYITSHFDSVDTNLPSQYKPINFIANIKDTIYETYYPYSSKTVDYVPKVGELKTNFIIRFKKRK